MDAQELRNLQEAYMEVYYELDEEITPARRRQYKAGLKVRQANQELDPGKAKPRKRGTPPIQHPNMRTGLTQDMRDKIRDDAREEDPDRPEGPGGITRNKRKLAQQKARGQHAEQVDIYDIILSHLLDEGYAETIESAEVIMVNMSEEWRDSICEEKRPLPVKKMDAKANELKSKFLKSKPGSPDAKHYISRASAITGTRDKNIVSDEDAKTREQWYGEKSIKRGTDRFSQLQKKAIESGKTKLF